MSPSLKNARESTARKRQRDRSGLESPPLAARAHRRFPVRFLQRHSGLCQQRSTRRQLPAVPHAKRDPLGCAATARRSRHVDASGQRARSCARRGRARVRTPHPPSRPYVARRNPRKGSGIGNAALHQVGGDLGLPAVHDSQKIPAGLIGASFRLQAKDGCAISPVSVELNLPPAELRVRSSKTSPVRPSRSAPSSRVSCGGSR